MMKTAKIQMTKSKKDELNHILSSNEFYKDSGRKDIIEQFTAKFGETGFEADIKICNGDGPYIDAILFEDGHEVQVLDPSWEIGDEFIFELEDEIYTVLVEVI